MTAFGRILQVVMAAGLLVFLSTGTPDAATNKLTGLRGGTVLMHAQKGGENITVRLSPVYGWNQRARLYGPDGRLLPEQPKSSRTEAYSSVLILKNPGLYRLRLPRSLRADIETTDVPIAFLPLRNETSLVGVPDRTLFFTVPKANSDITFYFSNRVGTRGEKVKARITTPQGQEKYLERAAFSTSSLMADLSIFNNANQALSEYSPEKLPSELLPSIIPVKRAQAGLWKLELTGGECGVWFDGIPGIFASSPDNLLAIEAAVASPDLPKAAVHAGQALKHIPFLGAVGSFDPVRYREQRLSLGIEADQLFLWPPEKQSGKAVSFSMTLARPSAPQMHTLLILRGRQKWMNEHAKGPEAGFAEWSAEAVRQFVQKSGRELTSFTVQVFSEPNLEMGLEEYLRYFSAVVERFDYDPVLRDVRLAGPATGSGQENDLVPWEWVETLIAKHGERLAAVCWNNYRLRDPEDSWKITSAIQETRALCERYGIAPDIFIGGINRMGGLAAPELFTGNDAGIWWAAILAAASNSGELNGIWYFRLTDSGARQKGLLADAAGGYKPKPQAIAHQAFSMALSTGTPHACISDHDLIDGLVVQDAAGVRQVLLLNKGWMATEVDVTAIGKLLAAPKAVLPVGAAIQATPDAIMMPPYTLVSFTARP